MTLVARDPLVRPRNRALRRTVVAVVFIASALAVHGVVIATAFVAGNAFARITPVPVYEPVEVTMLEPEPEPEPEREPEPEVKPEPEPQPKPKKKAEPPPPDPIDVAPPPPEKKNEPRRIVGISLESTVQGGGPSFAAGNTRMGKTAEIAEDPNEAKPLPKPAEKVLPNREATRVPVAKAVVVKPKPVGGMQEPPYPDLYQAQNIEADVTVRARIDSTGRVVEVEIVSPAAQPEFNRAAKETAQRQRFEPATRDGVPVEWTITFTYRFRLVD